MFVTVANEDVAFFMNFVKPNHKIEVDFSSCGDVEIKFTNEADFARGEEWLFKNYNYELEVETKSDKTGIVFWNEDSRSYGYEAYDDNHIEYGFACPKTAKDALIKYLEG